MAAPRQGATITALVCLTMLAATEYGTITYAVLPLPSTQTDWLVATLFIAPFLAIITLWFIVFTLRIIADALTGLRAVHRWLIGLRK